MPTDATPAPQILSLVRSPTPIAIDVGTSLTTATPGPGGDFNGDFGLDFSK